MRTLPEGRNNALLSPPVLVEPSWSVARKLSGDGDSAVPVGGRHVLIIAINV